jgi:hypothetical protein
VFSLPFSHALFFLRENGGMNTTKTKPDRASRKTKRVLARLFLALDKAVAAAAEIKRARAELTRLAEQRECPADE